jgi:hypothetical protein
MGIPKTKYKDNISSPMFTSSISTASHLISSSIFIKSFLKGNS